MLRVERLLVASDSYPGLVQNGSEIAFTSLSFITCTRILILQSGPNMQIIHRVQERQEQT